MIKTAYEMGVLRALSDLGLKLAGTDDPSLAQTGEGGAAQDNPAEQLAQLFQQADVPPVRQMPDNKTRETPEDGENGQKWGPAVHGTGGDSLERNVPGFHLGGGGAV